MKKAKTDEFGNDIFWYVFGSKDQDRVASIRVLEDLLTFDEFATSVKSDLRNNYFFLPSQWNFVVDQMANDSVVRQLFKRYIALRPKFTDGHIARDEQAIWGAGTSRASCIKNAKYWLTGGRGGEVKFTDTFELISSSERAVKAVLKNGPDAGQDIVLIDDEYYHKDEVSQYLPLD